LGKIREKKWKLRQEKELKRPKHKRGVLMDWQEKKSEEKRIPEACRPILQELPGDQKEKV